MSRPHSENAPKSCKQLRNETKRALKTAILQEELLQRVLDGKSPRSFEEFHTIVGTDHQQAASLADLRATKKPAGVCFISDCNQPHTSKTYYRSKLNGNQDVVRDKGGVTFVFVLVAKNGLHDESWLGILIELFCPPAHTHIVVSR